MYTLDETLKFHKINIAEYNHWIFDIQGAELMALQGASESIMYCKSIQIEISQKNYYEGGAKWMDIKNYLEKKNFYLSESPKKDHTEVLFIKKD